MEVSLYRPKAKTTYESVPISVSRMRIENFDDTPIINKRTSNSEHISVESPGQNNSLVYSKTPELTIRMPSDRIIKEMSEEENEHPNTISYHGRKFFLKS